MDDVRVPADITGTVDLSLIPTAGLGKVEILPGAASSVYGANAEGGVLHLFTRRLQPGARMASAETSYSAYDTRGYSVKTGAAERGFDIFLGVSGETSDGFQQNSKADKNSANGRVSLGLGAAGSLAVTGFYSDFETGLPSGTPVPIADWNGSRERTANSLTDWQTSKRSSIAGSWSGGGEDLALRLDSGLLSNKIDAFQSGSASGSRVADKSLSARATAYRRAGSRSPDAPFQPGLR